MSPSPLPPGVRSLAEEIYTPTSKEGGGINAPMQACAPQRGGASSRAYVGCEDGFPEQVDELQLVREQDVTRQTKEERMRAPKHVPPAPLGNCRIFSKATGKGASGWV